jgi:SNF2 family DNA or RNA helicase
MRKFGNVKFTDGLWVVEGEPHLILRMKRVFPKADKGTPGKLQLTHTPENCRDLIWFMDRYPLTIHPKHKAVLEAGSTEYEEKLLTLEKILAGKYSAKKLELAIPARDYQKTGAQLYLENGFLLLADDLGTGKSCTGICSLMDRRTLPALVVTMTHLTRQWREELEKFAPQLKSHIIKVGKPYELADKKTGTLPDVVIMNYHKLNGWADTLSKHVKSIIFDEIQELRRAGSGKYAAAEFIADQVKFKLGCSATPIYNYGGEMYNVCRILNEDALGSYEEFNREWCVGDSIADPKAFGSFLREKGIMLRRTRKDVGREIPPLTTVPHYIDSDTAALDKMQSSATELAKIILAGTERGDAFTASGQFESIMRQATGIAKAAFVADFVRMIVESGEPVVLFGWHHAVYEIWMQKLKDLKPVLYTGQETAVQKDEAKRKFCSKESPILIMSLRAGAGLDGLQYVCRTAVVGELDWSSGVLEQDFGRIARDGQKDPVTGYILLAEDGSDPIMADVLGVKKQQIDGIRDPDRDIIEKIQGSQSNHVKKLAQYYLDKLGVKIPEVVCEAGVEYIEEELV